MIKKLFSDVQIIYKIGNFPTTKLCIFYVYRGTRYASETTEYMILTLFWKNLKISAILLVILKNGVVVFEMNSLVFGNKAKGLISKQVFQENKARQISPWFVHVCVSGGKNCSFFGKFGVLCFLETLVLRFALLPYYRRSANNEDECRSDFGGD